MSHGVLPSQIRTLLSWLSVLSSNAFGGGAKGQPGVRDIGKSGTLVAVEISVIVLLASWPAQFSPTASHPPRSHGPARATGRQLRRSDLRRQLASWNATVARVRPARPRARRRCASAGCGPSRFARNALAWAGREGSG